MDVVPADQAADALLRALRGERGLASVDDDAARLG
jgi:hypothetical protein